MPSDQPQVESFANDVLGDWDSAMDQFFTRVHRKAVARSLTSLEVHQALGRGYGGDVADAWSEWIGVGDDA